MGDARDSTRLAAASEQIHQLEQKSEFWYLALKAAVGVVVRTAGTDAAEAMLESVREAALSDFPLDTGESRVSEQAATYLLDELRTFAGVWEEHGSLIGRAG